jgi:replicative DNA helicase
MSKSTLLERPLPADLDAERFVLSSVMLGTDFALVGSTISEGDFALDKYRRIFRACKALHDKGNPIDRITLAAELRNQGTLESIGGLTGLLEVDDGMPQIVNLDAYIQIVRDKATLREAILRCHQTIEDCLTQGEPTVDILARCERMISDLSGEVIPTGLLGLLDVVAASGGPSAFVEPSKRIKGIETPWGRLNQSLEGGGLLPGQMVVIGGRPGAGKTALACNIAAGAALNGHGTALFSLEMSDEAIMRRLIGAHAQVDQLRYSQGRGSIEDREAMELALTDLIGEDCKLWIASKCYTLPSIRASLCKLAAKKRIELVVIDYLQLIETSGGSEKRRWEQMSEISRQVKRLAEEFRVPVIALAQLNREMEKEQRPPRASDLRDSGSIEQDADMILMPFVLPDKDQAGGVAGDTPFVDLIIAKQRNGHVGKIPLVFRKRFTRFDER